MIQLDFAITTVVKQVEGFLELCKFEKKNQCTVTEIQLILEIYPQTPSTLVKSYFFGISYVYIFDVDFAIILIFYSLKLELHMKKKVE